MEISAQERDYARIERAIVFLERTRGEQPPLAKVAAEIGLSPFHFQRLFSRFAGVSPKRFLAYLLLAHAREKLRQSESVLATALDAGLSGPSRLYDLFVTFEAVTPGEFRRLGQGLPIRYGFHATPFGRALLLTSSRGLVGLSFVTGKGDGLALREQATRWPLAEMTQDQRATADIAECVFRRAGKTSAPISALVPGTNFQIKVWEALLRVPEGSSVSYTRIGEMIGRPEAARAIGTAVGANRLAYLIPCHRVIRQTGTFSDYHWGVERKRAMLAWEASQAYAVKPNTSRME
jgi:AraC family transcriptional regulator of adaptative response/methylated-DNA-[protein]-cysteine methyltransferase